MKKELTTTRNVMILHIQRRCLKGEAIATPDHEQFAHLLIRYEHVATIRRESQAGRLADLLLAHHDDVVTALLIASMDRRIAATFFGEIQHASVVADNALQLIG